MERLGEIDFSNKLLFGSPVGETTNDASYKPENSKNDLHDKNGTSLSASVGTERIEGTPFTSKRAFNTVVEPKEGNDETDAYTEIPQEV